MGKAEKLHGGLVFKSEDRAGIDRFCRIVTATLEDYGHPVERQTLQSDTMARVTASRYMVKLELQQRPATLPVTHARMQNAFAETDQDADRETEDYLVLSLFPVDAENDDTSHSELLLVVMLYRIVEAYRAAAVEWLSIDAVVPVRHFLTAFENVSPRRVRARQEVIDTPRERFAPVDETERALGQTFETITGQHIGWDKEGPVDLSDEERVAFAFRADEDEIDEFDMSEDNDVGRLAAWGMTGVVFTISAPVALSLAAVNVVRGENIRFNTHALALTACVAGLQGSGLLDRVMSVVAI